MVVKGDLAGSFKIHAETHVPHLDQQPDDLSCQTRFRASISVAIKNLAGTLTRAGMTDIRCLHNTDTDELGATDCTTIPHLVRLEALNLA